MARQAFARTERLPGLRKPPRISKLFSYQTVQFVKTCQLPELLGVQREILGEVCVEKPQMPGGIEQDDSSCNCIQDAGDFCFQLAGFSFGPLHYRAFFETQQEIMGVRERRTERNFYWKAR